jgi:hypothetical protein
LPFNLEFSADPGCGIVKVNGWHSGKISTSSDDLSELGGFISAIILGCSAQRRGWSSITGEISRAGHNWIQSQVTQ